MTAKANVELTGALEDYLETIHELSSENGFARVKDIARARDVKPASVSPALRRLAELALIRYERREYIILTPEGAEAARRVLSRHRLLTRFLHEILQLPPALADRDACLIEHHLSDEAMDGLARFFEFLATCQQGKTGFVELFHACQAIQATSSGCSRCQTVSQRTLDQLKAGQRGRVRSVGGPPATRQRLLDLGLLPDVEVIVERVDSDEGRFWIKMLGFQLTLPREEAQVIQLEPLLLV